jgi:hypothetical protein
LLFEQTDSIKEQRKKMQLNMMTEQKKEGQAPRKKAEKHVPEVAISAKFLMQQKKDQEKAAEKAKK